MDNLSWISVWSSLLLQPICLVNKSDCLPSTWFIRTRLPRWEGKGLNGSTIWVVALLATAHMVVAMVVLQLVLCCSCSSRTRGSNCSVTGWRSCQHGCLPAVCHPHVRHPGEGDVAAAAAAAREPAVLHRRAEGLRGWDHGRLCWCRVVWQKRESTVAVALLAAALWGSRRGDGEGLAAQGRGGHVTAAIVVVGQEREVLPVLAVEEGTGAGTIEVDGRVVLVLEHVGLRLNHRPFGLCHGCGEELRVRCEPCHSWTTWENKHKSDVWPHQQWGNASKLHGQSTG